MTRIGNLVVSKTYGKERYSMQIGRTLITISADTGSVNVHNLDGRHFDIHDVPEQTKAKMSDCVWIELEHYHEL